MTDANIGANMLHYMSCAFLGLVERAEFKTTTKPVIYIPSTARLFQPCTWEDCKIIHFDFKPICQMLSG